jgi:hypothetical protein
MEWKDRDEHGQLTKKHYYILLKKQSTTDKDKLLPDESMEKVTSEHSVLIIGL